MNFGQALETIKQGGKVARKGWNGKGIYLGLHQVETAVDARGVKMPTVPIGEMTHDYIYIDTTGLQTDNPDAPKDRVPWLASQTDMLADDWYGIGEGIQKSPNKGTLGVYGATLKHTHIKPRKDTLTINVNVNGLDRLKPVSEVVDEAIRKAYDRAYKELKADLESGEDDEY
jgi:hypothetical protein